jgi:hypothetical protein
VLAVLSTLTPGHRNTFIECQQAKVHITVLHIMQVKTQWNSRVEMLERADRLGEVIREWLKHPEYCHCRPLFTTQDECTIVNYFKEILRQFRYWTQWMLKRHTVSRHHVITVYNDMFNRMHGLMQAVSKKKTQWMEDLYLAVKVATEAVQILH